MSTREKKKKKGKLGLNLYLGTILISDAMMKCQKKCLELLAFI